MYHQLSCYLFSFQFLFYSFRNIIAFQSTDSDISICFCFLTICFDDTFQVNPPRPNASVMDEASHRIRTKMSRMQGVPDCCFRQHGISDYRYSLSSAHLVTRQISDLPLMCQVPQISELG